ncbi:hypothetical protein WBG78_21595 [Chryseolinea sp. T2]|uniref:hypothetical protein n=1 Tax=Chryseolinea sp. T2 TaxID=3129255 RepID=UPI00307899F0
MKKWVLIASAVMVVQIITFVTIADRQLTGKLMDDDWCSAIHHFSDTILVKDFYTTDCMTGDSWSYRSQQLSSHPSLIKSKFNVQFVKFQRRSDLDSLFQEQLQHQLFYVTWTAQPQPLSIHGPFSIKTYEWVRVGGGDFYERVVTYRWTLFYWRKTWERISHDSKEQFTMSTTYN